MKRLCKIEKSMRKRNSTWSGKNRSRVEVNNQASLTFTNLMMNLTSTQAISEEMLFLMIWWLQAQGKLRVQSQLNTPNQERSLGPRNKNKMFSSHSFHWKWNKKLQCHNAKTQALIFEKSYYIESPKLM